MKIGLSHQSELISSFLVFIKCCKMYAPGRTLSGFFVIFQIKKSLNIKTLIVFETLK